METLQSLRHSRWDCKYHVVWIPKCRKKKLYGRLRKELGAVFHELARQKECRVIEGHLLGITYICGSRFRRSMWCRR